MLSIVYRVGDGGRIEVLAVGRRTGSEVYRRALERLADHTVAYVPPCVVCDGRGCEFCAASQRAAGGGVERRWERYARLRRAEEGRRRLRELR